MTHVLLLKRVAAYPSPLFGVVLPWPHRTHTGPLSLWRVCLSLFVVSLPLFLFCFNVPLLLLSRSFSFHACDCVRAFGGFTYHPCWWRIRKAGCSTSSPALPSMCLYLCLRVCWRLPWLTLFFLPPSVPFFYAFLSSLYFGSSANVRVSLCLSVCLSSTS